MHARDERPSIVGAARDVREPRSGHAGELGDAPRLVPTVGQPGTGEHHAVGSRGAERLVDVRAPPEDDVLLLAGAAQDVLRDVPEAGASRMQDVDLRPAPGGLAQAQVQDRHLLLRVQPGDQDDLRALDVVVRDRLLTRGAGRHHLLHEPGGATVAPMVQVVRAEDRPRELGHGVVVLVHQAPAGQERDALAGTPSGDHGQHLAEGRRLQPPVADQRRRHPLGRVGEPEREPALVAQPGVVDLEVVAGQLPDDLAAPDVELDVAAGAAMGTHGVHRRQVERPRHEPVRRGGERADRADLDRCCR